MGKSTAARLLKIMGVPVHNSDIAVHRALAPRGEAFEDVALNFPEAWNKDKRTIDRKKLGAIVFFDADKRKNLEQILHPIARHAQDAFIRRMRLSGKKIIGLDIPLLFETGAEARVDVTICVSAPETIQRRRVLARPGMDEERLNAILAAQMTDAEKCARADFVVQTGLGYAHTFRALQKILKQVKKDHA
jgi:dephospho-CoA kinase